MEGRKEDNRPPLSCRSLLSKLVLEAVVASDDVPVGSIPRLEVAVVVVEVDAVFLVPIVQTGAVITDLEELDFDLERLWYLLCMELNNDRPRSLAPDKALLISSR